MATTGDDDLGRLRNAAIRAKAAEQTYRDALEIRDQLVLHLYDAGYAVRTVASTALLTVPRVIQIVAARG